MNTYLLMITFRIWLAELLVSGINYFVLIKRVYEPRVGELRAHRIGMLTRIAYIFAFAYVLVTASGADDVGDYLLAGGFWLALILAFEWVGSFLLRRPIDEILAGWHVERGYMWPYVLLAYLTSPVAVGLMLGAAR